MQKPKWCKREDIFGNQYWGWLFENKFYPFPSWSFISNTYKDSSVYYGSIKIKELP